MNSLEQSTAAEIEAPVEKSPSISAGAGALALAGVGALALGALAASPARAISPALKFADIPGTGDIKVLNYALSLEDLETELYVQALQRMTTGGRGGRDAPIGLNIPGLGLSASRRDVSITALFGRVERQHRDFLRNSITAAGGTAITPFNYAFGIERMTLAQVLNLLYTIEQGGTSAYLGATPFFATKRFTQVAAAIQGTEARHTAIFADILNDELRQNILPSPPPTILPGGRERPVAPDPTLAVVSPFILPRGSSNPGA